MRLPTGRPWIEYPCQIPLYRAILLSYDHSNLSTKLSFKNNFLAITVNVWTHQKLISSKIETTRHTLHFELVLRHANNNYYHRVEPVSHKNK